MSDIPDGLSSLPGPNESDPYSGIDTSRAHPARIYDCLLGGTNNFPADRDAVEKIIQSSPAARAEAMANREFLRRVVAYAAGQGITQFLDIGAGIPTVDPTHEIAQKVVPESRIAYVDHDPIVLVHSRALLTGNSQTVAIQADVREPETILCDPAVRGLLDFGRPIALMLVGLLYFIDDADDPWGLVARYRDALVPGSHLLLSHVIETPESRSVVKTYETASSRLSPRTPGRVEALFDGWTMVDPGLVHVHDWHPTGGETPARQMIGGVGVLT